MMLWRSLRGRLKGLPAFGVAFALLIVALASRGDADGVVFALVMIFGPFLLLRAFAMIAVLILLHRR